MNRCRRARKCDTRRLMHARAQSESLASSSLTRAAKQSVSPLPLPRRVCVYRSSSGQWRVVLAFPYRYRILELLQVRIASLTEDKFKIGWLEIFACCSITIPIGGIVWFFFRMRKKTAIRFRKARTRSQVVGEGQGWGEGRRPLRIWARGNIERVWVPFGFRFLRGA